MIGCGAVAVEMLWRDRLNAVLGDQIYGTW